MKLRSIVLVGVAVALVVVAAPAGAESPAPPLTPPTLDPIQQRKGHLHLPLVFGATQYRFGTRPAAASRGRVRHTGWTITASPKHRVRAAMAGQVVFAEALPGYGLTVVIDHGHGYHSVYAHLKKALVVVGGEVQWGAPLGVIGSTGTLGDVMLYFELRHHGRPIDPEGWFASAAELKRRLKE